MSKDDFDQFLETLLTHQDIPGKDGTPVEHDPGMTLHPIDTPHIRQTRDRLFLPSIPERLFCRVARLPGKALAVYMVLRFRSRLEHTTTVTLTSATLQHFGLTRYEKYTALRVLEAAGLITVDRRARKNPLVTLLGETSREGATDVSTR